MKLIAIVFTLFQLAVGDSIYQNRLGNSLSGSDLARRHRQTTLTSEKLHMLKIMRQKPAYKSFIMQMLIRM